MSEPLYCDVLHSHPPIELLETLTSYSTRIGHENLIKTVNGISQLLFPETSPRQIRNLNDLPLLNFSTMAISTNKSVERLLETTFYYLGQNFGRSTRPQAISRFLSGAISGSLRYCPLCVKENNYYSILWRFNHILGCEKHGCKLLDSCPHCGSNIPLFVTPLRIGVCPKCNKNFYEVEADSLSEEEKIITKSLCKDLSIFLSPSVYPYQLFVGGILRIYRLYKGISLVEMARKMGKSNEIITNSEIIHINGGKIVLSKGKLNFVEHLEYIKILGSPFHEIIKSSFFQEDYKDTVLISNDKTFIETRLRTPKNGIANGEENFGMDKKSKNSHITGRLYNRTKGLSFKEIKEKVQKSIDEIQLNGDKPVIDRIAEKAGLTRNQLYYYPELRQIIPNRNDLLYEDHLNRETEMLNIIDVNSDMLLAQKEFISYSMVSRMTNIPLHRMLYYHRVKEKIDQLVIQQITLMEDNLLASLELFSSTDSFIKSPYKSTILKHLGLSDFLLRHFPRLQTRIYEITMKPEKEKSLVMMFVGSIYNRNGEEITIVKGEKES